MSDIERLAAHIRPFVRFTAGGMHVDVRKWLLHTYKGKEMDEMKFASLVDSAAKLISGAPFPSTHSFTKARQVVELILAAQQPQGVPEMLSAHGVRALDNSIRELRSMVEQAKDFDLDEMAVGAFETAIESMEMRKKAAAPSAERQG